MMKKNLAMMSILAGAMLAGNDEIFNTDDIREPKTRRKPKKYKSIGTQVDAKDYKRVNGTYVKIKDIGRNDPCDCGSGKKYKKCCI